MVLVSIACHLDCLLESVYRSRGPPDQKLERSSESVVLKTAQHQSLQLSQHDGKTFHAASSRIVHRNAEPSLQP